MGPRRDHTDRTTNALLTEANPALGQRLELAKVRLADDPVPPNVAAGLIEQELMLDGSARLNLATFVTTWMEPEARALIASCLDKNIIDKDEYPQTAEIEQRCLAIIADLWHAPDAAHPTGCSTTGSSEAAMLGGLALLRRWRARVGEHAGRPNLVMGANVQVCWERFCRYWDVEARMVPMEGDRFHLEAPQAVAACDENTIGVVAILGSTYDGSYEPVAEIAAALDALASAGGPDVPVHVDAASGGMIAPFIDQALEWDFRLARVASINTSGHKYGLVYPGLGWILWRDTAALPRELVFSVDYLGGDMPILGLNFSRPGAQVIAQYYNFVRLGREGYRAVQQSTRDVATFIAARISEFDQFRLITGGTELPVVAFTTADGFTDWDVYTVSTALRERGWQVPAYPFPADRTDLSVLRIVCRNGFSHDMAEAFARDLRAAVDELNAGRGSASVRTGFHH